MDDMLAQMQSELEAGQRASLQMIRVTNKNRFPINDMFDGVPYRFKSHEPLVIPPDAARHFFAWPGDRDARIEYMSKRYAWNRATKDMAYLQPVPGAEDDRTLAEKYVDNVVIEPQRFDLVPRVEGDSMPPDANADYNIPVPIGGPDDDGGTHAGKRKPTPPKRLNV